MRISLEWLSEYVDLAGIAPGEIADRLTTSCAEVEELVRIEHPWEGVAVAEVAAADGRGLRIRSRGREEVVACRAQSVRAGQAVLYAPPGSGAAPEGRGPLLPRDLGFDLPGEECIVLPLPTSGEELAAMPRVDWILCIDNKSLTHRPDLWGHYGFARELAALFGRDLEPLATDSPAAADRLPEYPLRVAAPEDCPCYGAMLLGAPPAALSPLWLQARLLAMGQRPLGLVIDASNYVMYELGQPTHTFDAELVRGVEVARVESAVVFHGLDGLERALEPGDLAIWSGSRLVALAGIIGSHEAQVSQRTRRVLLESACFRAGRVRATSRRLDLRTAASERYEKGQPPANAALAVSRYLGLMRDCGAPAEALSSLTVRAVRSPEPPIRLPLELLRSRAGAAIAMDEARDILRRLGFDAASEGGVLVTRTPAHRSRGDISIPEDIIEEIVRVHGYAGIEPVLPLITARPAPRDPALVRDRACRVALSCHHGFMEVHTYAWYDSSWLARLGYAPSGCAELRNPTADDLRFLRTELLPNLLRAASENAPRREAFVLYEIGRVFRQGGPRTEERTHLAAVSVRQRRRLSAQEQLLALKGALEDALHAMGAAEAGFHPAAGRSGSWEGEGRSADIVSGDCVCGRLGLAADVVSGIVAAGVRLAWLEVDLDTLSLHSRGASRYEPLPAFPGSWHDFSLLWPEERSYAELEAELRGFRDERVLRREMRGSYRGSGVPTGLVCHTIRYHLGSPERTLEGGDLAEVMERFGSFIEQRGIRLR